MDYTINDEHKQKRSVCLGVGETKGEIVQFIIKINFIAPYAIVTKILYSKNLFPVAAKQCTGLHTRPL